MSNVSDPDTLSENQKKEREIIRAMPSMRHFAISLTRDNTRADDLVQEALMKAIAHMASYALGSNVKAWLFMILRNTYFSEIRKRKRETPWDDSFSDSMAFSTHGTLVQAESMYQLHEVLLRIACLPVEQSQALLAVGYLGLTYNEAADRLDCAEGTIKSRVNRARVALLDQAELKLPSAVDMSHLKNATEGVDPAHKFYPLAKVYQELYTALDASVNAPSKRSEAAMKRLHSKLETLWQNLVTSGIMDDHDDLATLMRGNENGD